MQRKEPETNETVETTEKPNSAQSFNALGNKLLNENNYLEAITAYVQAIKLDCVAT